MNEEQIIKELFAKAKPLMIDPDPVPPPRKIVGAVHITENFTLYLCKMPSRFHRWMAKLLLGWKYEEYGG